MITELNDIAKCQDIWYEYYTVEPNTIRSACIKVPFGRLEIFYDKLYYINIITDKYFSIHFKSIQECITYLKAYNIKFKKVNPLILGRQAVLK